MTEIDRVREILHLVQGTRITELDVRVGENRLRIRRSADVAAAPMADANTTPPEPHQAPIPVILGSPVVGQFRAREPAAQVGDRVAEGETLGAVESMKLLTPMTATITGSIAAVLVEEGEPVEYGQPLFEVIPD